MAHLRNCILCGTEYDYCPRCDETRPTFYLKYCGENCRDISLILNRYAFKHLTKEEAAEELSKCDLSKLESFNEKEREYIKEILKAPKPVVIEEPVVEEEVPVEESIEAPIESVPIRRKPNNKRK